MKQNLEDLKAECRTLVLEHESILRKTAHPGKALSKRKSLLDYADYIFRHGQRNGHKSLRDAIHKAISGSTES